MAFKKVSPETTERAESFFNPVEGDSITGMVVRYIPPKKKKSYGFYVMKTDLGCIGVNDCYAIGSILREDFGDLQSKLKAESVGATVRLTYRGKLELDSGNTVKQFDVEIDDGQGEPAKPAKRQNSKKAPEKDEDVPF
jgi:hypothetical protein